MADRKRRPGPSPDRVWDRLADRILAAAALLVLTLGTTVYHALEDWSWVDAFYFSTVAVTTVGFGDLAPSSDVSKLFTVFYIFSGVSIVTLFLNERLKRHRRLLPERKPDDAPRGAQVWSPDPETGSLDHR